MVGPLSVVCGQMIVVGLSGTRLLPDEARALEEGRRGGAVLFKRNVGTMPEVAELCRAVTKASKEPPLLAIDQEGGRVARLREPCLVLPPMRKIGDLGDEDFTTRLAEAQGRELRALGLTMSFAPVADVHTRPENPIIGDRAFAETPEGVARQAGAWAAGLARAGILSCAKHFPGHGDTTLDSHLALPRVERDREGLHRIEIATFRALAKKVDSMMSAHVVYPALDAERPATLSRAICTDLLRGELGFEGVLFSDDLEMKAISLPIAEAAVLAVDAGCDVLLVCARADLADEAHGALVREAEKSAAFERRCKAAANRALAMRRRAVPTFADDLDRVFAESKAISAELGRRLA